MRGYGTYTGEWPVSVNTFYRRHMNIIFDKESFGITQKSLKILRDELARRIDNEIIVYEIPVNDICCGFIIIDKTRDEAVWTGDGFRFDRGGEGGAGYKTAEALFQIYGIQVYQYTTLNLVLDDLWQDSKNKLMVLTEEINKGSVMDMRFMKLSEKKPSYLRG